VAGENNTCYIQGIANSSIPTANAAIVFVNLMSGKLATVLTDANGNRLTVPISQSQLQPAPLSHPNAVPERYFEDGHQAMLNRKVETLQAAVAQQNKQIETLTAQLKEQAAQIQKVSAQLEVSKSAPRVVTNKP
jgi:septal ring factor EnvC (AmiA/AmiB activator)